MIAVRVWGECSVRAHLSGAESYHVMPGVKNQTVGALTRAVGCH